MLGDAGAHDFGKFNRNALRAGAAKHFDQNIGLGDLLC
jgi:hypothetical protein